MVKLVKHAAAAATLETFTRERASELAHMVAHDSAAKLYGIK